MKEALNTSLGICLETFTPDRLKYSPHPIVEPSTCSILMFYWIERESGISKQTTVHSFTLGES